MAHPLARWVAGGVGVGLVMGLLILIYWRAPASLEEESSHITFFQIGTGPSDGAYFAWGGRLAAAISRPPDAGACEPGAPCGVEGVLAVVKSSSGSVANVRAVSTHHIQSAFIQSVVLDQATTATGAFKGEKPYASLRAIANIQRETVYLVAGRGVAITTPEELKGLRVGLGVKGSGTEYVALTLLRAYGISKRSIEVVYEEPVRLADMLLRNQLDAFVYVASDPSPFITDLADRGTVDLVPLEGEKIDALLQEHRDLTPISISDGTYRFIPAFKTLAVNVVWVVDARETPFLVRDLTEALFRIRNRDLLPMASVQVAQPFGPLRPTREALVEERRRLMLEAVHNLVIPLHPGAEQFYRQENIIAAAP